LAVVVALAFVVVPVVASAASLVTPAAGITDRSLLDLWTDFNVFDTGQPATAPGAISSIDYYAGATGTIRSLVVDASDVVKYQTLEIVVASTGAHTYTLPAPVAVAMGDRLGHYTQGSGVIPYDHNGSATPTAVWTGLGSGRPTVGQPLGIVAGTGQDRTYSVGATVLPASKDECRRGG
jgi:hypothetical protein